MKIKAPIIKKRFNKTQKYIMGVLSIKMLHGKHDARTRNSLRTAEELYSDSGYSEADIFIELGNLSRLGYIDSCWRISKGEESLYYFRTETQ